MAAQDVAAKFVSVSGVSPDLFSSIQDSAAETGQDNQDNKGAAQDGETTGEQEAQQQDGAEQTQGEAQQDAESAGTDETGETAAETVEPLDQQTAESTEDVPLEQPVFEEIITTGDIMVTGHADAATAGACNGYDNDDRRGCSTASTAAAGFIHNYYV